MKLWKTGRERSKSRGKIQCRVAKSTGKKLEDWIYILNAFGKVLNVCHHLVFLTGFYEQMYHFNIWAPNITSYLPMALTRRIWSTDVNLVTIRGKQHFCKIFWPSVNHYSYMNLNFSNPLFLYITLSLLTIIWYVSIASLQYEMYPGSSLSDLLHGLAVCHLSCAVSVNLHELITHLQYESAKPSVTQRNVNNRT